MEAEELYPPRFMIDVCGTQAHATGQLWVNFSGMMKEFKSELILDANRGMCCHENHTTMLVKKKMYIYIFFFSMQY